MRVHTSQPSSTLDCTRCSKRFSCDTSVYLYSDSVPAITHTPGRFRTMVALPLRDHRSLKQTHSCQHLALILVRLLCFTMYSTSPNPLASSACRAAAQFSRARKPHPAVAQACLSGVPNKRYVRSVFLDFPVRRAREGPTAFDAVSVICCCRLNTPFDHVSAPRSTDTRPRASGRTPRRHDGCARPPRHAPRRTPRSRRPRPLRVQHAARRSRSRPVNPRSVS